GSGGGSLVVEIDREIEVGMTRLLGGLRRGFLFIRTQADKRDAVLVELLDHVGERLRIAIRNRTFKRQKDQHDRLFVPEGVKGLRLAIFVLENKVRDFLAKVSGGRFPLSVGGPSDQQPDQKNATQMA